KKKTPPIPVTFGVLSSFVCLSIFDIALFVFGSYKYHCNCSCINPDGQSPETTFNRIVSIIELSFDGRRSRIIPYYHLAFYNVWEIFRRDNARSYPLGQRTKRGDKS